MAADPPELDFDVLDAATESAPKASTAVKDDSAPLSGEIPKAKRQQPVWEVSAIFGGVFVGMGLIAWVFYAFFFKGDENDETTIELPRNRMETVMMELPVGNLRFQGPISKSPGKTQQLVMIVEIDASVIVQGTAGELVEVENLLKSHHHRIEEVLDETVRSAKPADLSEPDALTIRTRIRDRINGFFSRPLVKEVIFSHFRAFRTPVKTG